MFSILPAQIWLIKEDVLDQYRKQNKYKKVHFEGTYTIREEIRKLARNADDFRNTWSKIKTYLQFPYQIGGNETISQDEIREEIINRLGTIMQCYSEEGVHRTYVNDFIYEMIKYNFHQLPLHEFEVVLLSKKSVDLLFRKRGLDAVDPRFSAEYCFDIESPSSQLPEIEDRIEKVNHLKHHLMLIERLGIIDFIRNRCIVASTGDDLNNESQMARILATVMGYEDWQTLKRQLNRLKMDDTPFGLKPYRNTKSIQAVSKILAQLDIEVKSGK